MSSNRPPSLSGAATLLCALRGIEFRSRSYQRRI
ncbi:unnamed protein product [Calypogeia fissa]